MNHYNEEDMDMIIAEINVTCKEANSKIVRIHKVLDDVIDRAKVEDRDSDYDCLIYVRELLDEIVTALMRRVIE